MVSAVPNFFFCSAGVRIIDISSEQPHSSRKSFNDGSAFPRERTFRKDQSFRGHQPRYGENFREKKPFRGKWYANDDAERSRPSQFRKLEA